MTLEDIKSKIRELSHLICKSGNLSIGFDHFLVAFPSILLMAKLLDSCNYNSNSISLLLFSTGFCNFLLYIVTKRKIPVCVAPSFAFCGFITATMKYSNAATAHINVFIGCLFASFLFLFIAVLYLFPKISKYIRLTLPDALVGPLISLIGLDLLDTAIEDSGLKAYPLNLNTIFVAAVTLSTIIICTTFKRSFFKNASVVIGVFAGLVASGVVLHYKPDFSNHIFNSPITAIAELISVTNTSAIHFEEIEWLNIFIAIIPTTVVVFSENITKITLLEKIIRAEKSKEEPVAESAETSSGKNDFENFYQRSILGHAISFLASVMMRFRS